MEPLVQSPLHALRHDQRPMPHPRVCFQCLRINTIPKLSRIHVPPKQSSTSGGCHPQLQPHEVCGTTPWDVVEVCKESANARPTSLLLLLRDEIMVLCVRLPNIVAQHLSMLHVSTAYVGKMGDALIDASK